jgi:uncharacterized protein YciI
MEVKPMKNRITSIIFLIVLSLVSLAHAQKSQAPKLVQFQMAIMKKGPKWATTSEQERNPILHQHLRNFVALLNSGKIVIAGPFADDTNLAGIFILRANSLAEAKTWVDADPAVKAGLFTPEMHPWFSEDIFKKANMPLQFQMVYFGFLKKGPNRKEGDDKDPAIQELQKAHIANINRLAEMKKLVAAGPFGDDGELRGIFVFRVDSLPEAQDLCATDPMIKIDRLRVELHPWQVPAGVLP